MIHKYAVPVDGNWHTFDLGPIAHVAHQETGFVTVWFWAPQRNEPRPSKTQFRAFATGEWIPATCAHVGTAVDPKGLVWHLFAAPVDLEDA